MPNKFAHMSYDELLNYMETASISDVVFKHIEQTIRIKSTKDQIASAQALADAIDKSKNIFQTQTEKMLSSGDKMFWATVGGTVVMAGLTCAIAYSALVQAGVF